ncbi:acyltransferase [Burkholderia vietnamiensis]|uniref:acyltransferase family protein n=1 Tax=Burkholderia vietnamiensis TaxID=60552 RepID=UPI0020194BB9|nr:acyltransferase [Burkholderia vietnamiensis]MCO1346588.1 acyltransferase [Burkholderia vietnamiensis]MCO1429320.1 acyltransferase [Burkholderia vietnamiensis]UQN50910.1 acyltransferase [Burkholderia vietnamiensis]
MNGADMRNRKIDFLRGFSILLVLFHHFNIAYRLDDTALSHVFGWNAVRAVARNGNYGVTMFFVISGYLITKNAMRRWSELGHVDIGTFYALRIARIVPCLLLLLAIVNALALAGIAIFQNHSPAGTPVSFWLVNLASLTFWMNVLVGSHGWTNYALGVLWSLSVEEVFYLSFPLLCVALRREARLVVFWLSCIVAGPVYRFFHQGDEGDYLYAYLACFDAIAIGCCAALLARKVKWHGRAQTMFTGLTAAGMALVYLSWPIGQSNVLGVTAIAFGTAVLLLAANCAAGTSLRPARVSALIEALGKLSYELYLFHLIVLGLLRTSYPPSHVTGDEKLALLVGYLLLSVGLGATIARNYAEPSNRVVRKWLMPRRANRQANAPRRIGATSKPPDLDSHERLE